jgi:hypothetical protein
MFGFIRKAKQQADTIRNEVVDDLSNLLVHIAYRYAVANGFKEGDEKTKALFESQGKIVIGFESVRMGAHPKEISDPLIKNAANIAFNTLGTASLGGKVNMEKIAGELRYLLDFYREIPEIR